MLEQRMQGLCALAVCRFSLWLGGLDTCTALPGSGALRELRIESCELQAIPPGVWNSGRGLRVLRLEGNSLTHIPSELSRLTALEHLGLSYNGYLRFNSSMSALVSLTRLEVQGCTLAGGIACLGTLPALRELDLAGCVVSDTPGNLPELVRLCARLQATGTRLLWEEAP